MIMEYHNLIISTWQTAIAILPDSTKACRDVCKSDVPKVSQTVSIGFRVENQGNIGISLRTDEISVSFMNRGSAVIVGAKDEEGRAIKLYRDLLGRTQ